MTDPLVLMVIGWTILGIECVHVFLKTPPSIWVGVPFAVATTAYALLKVRKTKRILRNYRRGEEGERIVSQVIEQDLIPLGYTVFHDI